MFNDFSEDIVPLTVTDTGATVDAADHPIARGGGGFVPAPVNVNIILMPGRPG